MAESDLLCIAPHQVDEFWDYAEPLLKAGCDRCGEWSVAQIKGELNRGALLWIIWNGEELKAACVTRLVLIKNQKICQVLVCGGHNEDWRTRFEEIEDYARNEGCAKTQIQGREGWRKIFSDYDLAWVVLEKRLDN